VDKKNTGNNQMQKGKSTNPVQTLGKGFHILAKPIGPMCNLDCRYCFYSEKKSLFPERTDFHMTDEVLEAFIKKYINAQQVPEIQFVWQGGEPMLMGLDFYRRVVLLQKKYGKNRKIMNSLQTNGTILDDAWCKFLKENGFLVGLSLDGPDTYHDRYRVDVNGRPTSPRVLRGLSLLQKHDVPFNVLICVTRESVENPLGIYRFLKEKGARFIQFTPVVERPPDREALKLNLQNAVPPDRQTEIQQMGVTPWSVESEAYGDFLISIFDEWVRKDVGSVYVMNFEWALQAWLGLPSTICIFAEKCGRAMALEHNGDVYSCDHYVYPRYSLGNILTDMPDEMVRSVTQTTFGISKEEQLPQVCVKCDVRFACNGECPRHRFLKTADGEFGLSYLCAGYKKYFRYIHRYMKIMKQLIENNQPADRIMEVIRGPLLILEKGSSFTIPGG
jgi:uncharacterized protein